MLNYNRNFDHVLLKIKFSENLNHKGFVGFPEAEFSPCNFVMQTKAY